MRSALAVMPSPRSLCLAPALALFAAGGVWGQDSAEFLSVAARYGQINTIAGSGARDLCNDWWAGNEGGPATGADLSRPHIAVADAEGNVYIADKEAYAIRKVDLAGRIHTVAGTGTFGLSPESGLATEMDLWGPNGIQVLPDGSLYFLTVNDNCDTGVVAAGGKIHKVTAGGTMTTIVEDDSLLSGRGLHVAPDESTIWYASGTEIKRWSSSGGISTLAAGFVNLGNIAMEAAGTLLATDRLGHQVWRVQPDGSKTVVAGSGGTSGGGHGQPATGTALNEVRGVAVVDTGGFFVCTHRGSQVWYVDTGGYIWLFIDGNRSDTTHSGDGLPVSAPGLKISEPRAVTVAPNGDLLITENDRGYVRRVTNITATPRLTALRLDPATGFHLRWTSHREASYLVRRSTDLLDWTTSAPLPGGSGSFTSHTDPLATSEPCTYYQVLEVGN